MHNYGLFACFQLGGTLRLLMISDLSPPPPPPYKSNKTDAQHKRLFSARLTASRSDRQLFIASSHCLVTLGKSQQKPTRTEPPDKRWVLDTGRWGRENEKSPSLAVINPSPPSPLNHTSPLKSGEGGGHVLPSTAPVSRPYCARAHFLFARTSLDGLSKKRGYSWSILLKSISGGLRITWAFIME